MKNKYKFIYLIKSRFYSAFFNDIINIVGDRMINKCLKLFILIIGCFTICGCSNIKVNKDLVAKTLFSRCEGQFKRNGLIVNGIRYRNISYKDEYLEGKKVIVAYDSNDVSKVFLIENGNYIEFELIEKELKDKTLEEVGVIKMNKNKVINEAKIVKCKSSIEIQKVLDELVESFDKDVEIDVKNVRKNRRKEVKKEVL